MEPAEVQHKVRTSLISNKNQWTPCDDIKPYPDLYFSTTFDLCSLEASPVSFWEICPIYYIKALKEVITIMVSSFILSKLSFLAVDLKKEPWKGWALSEATIKFWVLLAALSNCFFWKKSCTLCNDSSAITRTKNDHTGSWSSSWGVLCSRTLISEASGWRWKISNTVIWIHLEEDVRATWRLEQDYKIVFKQSKWSWGDFKWKQYFHRASYYFWCRSQQHRSWLPNRGGSLLLGRRPWRSPTVAALEYEVQLEILQPNNTRTGEIRSSQYFDPSWEPFCSRESYSSSENN